MTFRPVISVFTICGFRCYADVMTHHSTAEIVERLMRIVWSVIGGCTFLVLRKTFKN